MTRDEQKQIREQKKADKINQRQEKKDERKEVRAWDEMVKRAKAKDAWIED